MSGCCGCVDTCACCCCPCLYFWRPWRRPCKALLEFVFISGLLAVAANEVRKMDVGSFDFGDLIKGLVFGILNMSGVASCKNGVCKPGRNSNNFGSYCDDNGNCCWGHGCAQHNNQHTKYGRTHSGYGDDDGDDEDEYDYFEGRDWKRDWKRAKRE